MKRVVRSLLVIGLVMALMPSRSRAQTTDRSAVDDWLKMSEKQGDVPIGTKITMQNWQQYKQFMPLGMTKMFEGSYGWKMPQDVEMEVGPVHIGFSAQDLGGSDRKVRLADLG